MANIFKFFSNQKITPSLYEEIGINVKADQDINFLCYSCHILVKYDLRDVDQHMLACRPIGNNISLSVCIIILEY